MTLSLLIRRLDAIEADLERVSLSPAEALSRAAAGEVVICARPMGRALGVRRSAEAATSCGRGEPVAAVAGGTTRRDEEREPATAPPPPPSAPRQIFMEFG